MKANPVIMIADIIVKEIEWNGPFVRSSFIVSVHAFAI